VQTSVEKKMHDGEDFTDGRSGFAVRKELIYGTLRYGTVRYGTVVQ